MSDFIVTVHALERMEQRHKHLVRDMSGDAEIAHFIRHEVLEALAAGRFGLVPPIELAVWDPNRHLTRADAWQTCWTQSKERGYVFTEDERGIVVRTVLAGENKRSAMQKLRNELGKKFK